MKIHSIQHIVLTISIIVVFTLTLPPLGFSELVLVDDYVPQPRQGEEVWFYNRLGGDRGVIGEEEQFEWGDGFVTVTIRAGETFAGVWTSLNHPISEGIPLNFRKVLPDFILPEFQYAVNTIEIKIIDGKGNFKVELKDSDNNPLWHDNILLSGGPNWLSFELPETVENVQHLNWIIEGSQGDFVTVDEIFLEVSGPVLEDERKFFLWSYAQLLANYNDKTGLTRDRANWPAGDFDNVSATGMQAAAAVMAWHLGFIDEGSVRNIVENIKTAVKNLPRFNGLLPHFVRKGDRHPDSEWSSVDTAICLIALIEACQALGIPTEELEQMIKDINWKDLIIPNIGISHGYDKGGALIPNAWDIFGGETWLVIFACAAARGEVAEILYPQPPTYNGSGFIDEIAWLLMPPPRYDRWRNDLPAYRSQASNHQLGYYSTAHPYSTYPINGLFGLSAAEVPIPSLVPVPNPKDLDPVYQAFGVGGKHGCQTIPPNDRASDPNPESPFMPAPVVIPHYAAMISSLHSDKAVGMFQWLEETNLISPLNNVESLLIDEQGNIYWNALKGSWNLALTVLGFAEYLAGDFHPLYSAVEENTFLNAAYRLMQFPPVDVPKWEELVSSPENVIDFAVINDTVFALTKDGMLFKSDDIGTSWAPISMGLDTGTLHAIDADLGVLYATGGLYSATISAIVLNGHFIGRGMHRLM